MTKLRVTKYKTVNILPSIKFSALSLHMLVVKAKLHLKVTSVQRELHLKVTSVQRELPISMEYFNPADYYSVLPNYVTLFTFITIVGEILADIVSAINIFLVVLC